MATVTGITVARAQVIEDASIVSGHISDTGNLILVNHGGAEINAGLVTPSLPPVVAAWPIGSIFMSVSPANPATLLGGGTWARWGQGRVPVSLDSTQTEFDAVEETGGEKTHVLSVSEMPAHNHTGATGVQSAQHTHPQVVTAGTGGTASRNDYDSDSNGQTFPQGIQTQAELQSHTHAISSQGADNPHNNLPPYIVVYMWKRTA